MLQGKGFAHPTPKPGLRQLVARRKGGNMFTLVIVLVIVAVICNFGKIVEALMVLGKWLVVAVIGAAALAVVISALLQSVELAVVVIAIFAMIYLAINNKK